jgi:hypothetical protein
MNSEQMTFLSLIYNDLKAQIPDQNVSLDTFRIAVEEWQKSDLLGSAGPAADINQAVVEEAFRSLKIQEEMAGEIHEKEKLSEMNVWHRAYIDSTD